MKRRRTSNALTQLRSSLGKHIKENSISFVLCSLFGAITTIVVFLFTAPPTTPSQVKETLLAKTRRAIVEQRRVSRKALRLQNALCFTAQTDIGAPDTVLLFGGWGRIDEEFLPNHYVAIFDPTAEGVLDRLAGRQSFYELSSLTIIHEPSPDILEVTSFEALDVDRDGAKELHLRLRATWADGISVTPLIYKHRLSRGWDLVRLPSVERVAAEIVDGKQAHPDLPAIMHPFVAFGGLSDGSETNDTDMTSLFPLSLYQDDMPASHDGHEFHLCFLRNGGDYEIRRHPVKGHFQLAVLAQLADVYAVQADHHLVVIFFALDGVQLKPDRLWNWGYPMFSVRPMKTSDVSLDDIAIAGVRAHVAGNSFFGYTEFQRLEVGWDGEQKDSLDEE